MTMITHRRATLSCYILFTRVNGINDGKQGNKSLIHRETEKIAEPQERSEHDPCLSGKTMLEFLRV